jgi:hypothetical protein
MTSGFRNQDWVDRVSSARVWPVPIVECWCWHAAGRPNLPGHRHTAGHANGLHPSTVARNPAACRCLAAPPLDAASSPPKQPPSGKISTGPLLISAMRGREARARPQPLTVAPAHEGKRGSGRCTGSTTSGLRSPSASLPESFGLDSPVDARSW